MVNVNQLMNIGLSDNEARVYMAMLELGSASVMEISQKAGINRPTAYVQIESLKEFGLVSTQTKGKKQLFIAESPDQLEFVLDKKLDEIKQKKEEFQRTIPELLDLYRSSGVHPQVRFFEGAEGILRMQEILLKSGVKEVLGITSLDDVLNIFPNHTQNYSSRRIKNNIRSRLIYTSSRGAILSETDEKMLRETRFISADKMPFGGDMTIFGDSVAIIALRGKVSGIIIDHPEIANSFRNFFQFLWQFTDQAKKS